MFFWFVAALLTLGASLAVLLPLGRRRMSDSADADHDLEVYRDQLAELDRDAARGLIAAPEAEQARAEIGRRILRADARSQSAGMATAGSRGARAVGTLAVLAGPRVAWGIYAFIGSPDMPSQPLASRLAKNPAESSVEELVARAEAHLAANPADGRGWDVIAPIYLRLGRFGEAVNAYRNAIRLDGATAARESGAGEALAGAAGGMVTAQAREAFDRALKLSPGHPKASFYLATALAQEGRIAEAVVAWQGMLAMLPTDSPWRDPVQRAIAEGSSRLAAARATPGPSRDEVEAAAGMSQADRNAMIETMVAGLDDRLRKNPDDLEGWTRLVRSYVVLGRMDLARDALKRGTTGLGEQSEAAKELAAVSASLGLTAVD